MTSFRTQQWRFPQGEAESKIYKDDIDLTKSMVMLITGNLHHGAAHLPRNGIESDRDVQLGDQLLQLILPALPARTIVFKRR